MADRGSFVAAIRGPVMLITLGALFAIDYSAGVSIGKTSEAGHDVAECDQRRHMVRTDFQRDA